MNNRILWFKQLQSSLIFIMMMLIPFAVAGCDPPLDEADQSQEDQWGQENTSEVAYSPIQGGDWEISTPEEMNLDPDLVEDLYQDAEDLDTLYSVLLVKNGVLVAESYFNGGSAEEKTLLQSVSKSYISALVGLAIDKGCLSSLDQKMIEFFPKLVNEIGDPRKKGIALEEMLQMRAGYPDEETDPSYLEALYWGEYPDLIIDFPLISPPGTHFYYSNLTYNWLAIILSRACGGDLKTFAEEQIFLPMDTEVGNWLVDRDGHYIGSGGIHLRARDAAKFGQLYLDRGAYQGSQIISREWVQASLRTYSEKVKDYGWGFPFRDLGYGYGWWSASVGNHDFWFAWGHGGQLIVLLDEMNLVIVTTADPFFGQHDGNSWQHETDVFRLVGDFISSLPAY